LFFILTADFPIREFFGVNVHIEPSRLQVSYLCIGERGGALLDVASDINYWPSVLSGCCPPWMPGLSFFQAPNALALFNTVSAAETPVAAMMANAQTVTSTGFMYPFLHRNFILLVNGWNGRAFRGSRTLDLATTPWTSLLRGGFTETILHRWALPVSMLA
jgi:hypothetical protein